MKTTIIRDFTRLPDDDLVALANAVKTGSYKILIKRPGLFNTPKGIFAFLMKRKSYQFIFNDDRALYKYMLLSFDTQRRTINIPIAVFGVSPTNTVTFPIVIGQFCGAIIMIGKEQLSRIIDVEGQDCDRYFSSLLEIRKTLIAALFQAYHQYKGFTSVMSWETKARTSLTRLLAEQQNFIRKESHNGTTEFYFSKDPDDAEFKYLEGCRVRWMLLGRKRSDTWQNFCNRLVGVFSAWSKDKEKIGMIRYYRILFSLN